MHFVEITNEERSSCFRQCITLSIEFMAQLYCTKEKLKLKKSVTLSIMFWMIHLVKNIQRTLVIDSNSFCGWGSTVGMAKWPIFRKFETSNIEIKKVEFSTFYFQFHFLYLDLFELFKLSKYMIIYRIGNFWNFDSFTNCQILKIW